MAPSGKAEGSPKTVVSEIRPDWLLAALSGRRLRAALPPGEAVPPAAPVVPESAVQPSP